MAPDNALLVKAATREGGELGAEDACALFAAMLAGEVAAPELSAILAAWEDRRASLAEIIGFMRALDAHTGRLEVSREGPRSVVLPAARGTLRRANLTALLALLLKRYETPVLVHGLDGMDAAPGGGERRAAVPPRGANAGPVTTAQVLWELGIEPAASLADAQARLRHDGIAYVPLAVLAPGLARLLATPRPSPPAIARMVAMLIDPFAGDGYRVIGAAPADDLAAIREFLLAARTDALLFPGTEGEPFADPRGRAPLEHVARGVAASCVDVEAEESGHEASLPEATDPVTTAAWIARVLAGTEPVPPPIIAQLGCCLAGARRLGAAA
jgi:anthranilate phosphoribosyltransferase